MKIFRGSKEMFWLLYLNLPEQKIKITKRYGGYLLSSFQTFTLVQ